MKTMSLADISAHYGGYAKASRRAGCTKNNLHAQNKKYGGIKIPWNAFFEIDSNGQLPSNLTEEDIPDQWRAVFQVVYGDHKSLNKSS